MNEPATAGPQPVAAPLWRRIVAIVYDWIILAAVLFTATLLLLPFSGGDRIQPGPVYQLYLLLVIAVYFVAHWRWRGRTPGMRAWRLRVETPAGEQPSWRQALQRCGAALLSAAPLGAGFFAQLVDPEQRTWHDRLSGTRLRWYAKRRRG